MKKTKKIVYNPGPPPHIGWWATNKAWDSENYLFRWWDGQAWSWACDSNATPKLAAAIAKSIAGCHQSNIKWCDYWPENARVPRIDPRTAK